MIHVLMGTYETVEGESFDVLKVELDPNANLLTVYKKVQAYGDGRGVYESTLTTTDGSLVLPLCQACDLEIDEAGIARLVCECFYQFQNDAEENTYLSQLQ